jgi:hypothetical protein
MYYDIIQLLFTNTVLYCDENSAPPQKKIDYREQHTQQKEGGFVG